MKRLTLPGDLSSNSENTSARIPEHTHGSSSWWHAHYKCDHPACVEVYRANIREGARGRRRRALDECVTDPVTGRRVNTKLAPAGSGIPRRHGTRYGYETGRCQCPDCTRAVRRKNGALSWVAAPAGLPLLPRGMSAAVDAAATCLLSAVTMLALRYYLGIGTGHLRRDVLETMLALAAMPISLCWRRTGTHRLNNKLRNRQRLVAASTGGWGTTF